MLRYLRSGRLILTTIRDSEGRPRFYETLDTRTNARRLAYGPAWHGSDKSTTDGPAISEDEVPEVLEWFLEDEQSYWRHIIPDVGELVIFPGAFLHCVPKVGDTMVDQSTRNVYTVRHVPRGYGDVPWNGTVLFDKAVPVGASLRWSGEARSRCLVAFYADGGKPASITPGEDAPDADVGTAYRTVMRPTITYFLTLQEPATIGPKPFGRDKELKPRVRDEFRDPERPQVTIRVLGHRLENLFRFRCLHPRAAVASGLALWFKRAVKNNASSLESNGVNKILFESHRQTPRLELGGDHVSGQDVTFYFRTEELVLEENSALRRVDLRVGAAVGSENAQGIQVVAVDDLDQYTGYYDQSGNYLYGDVDIADFGQTGTALP